MTPDVVIDLFRGALHTVIVIVASIILPGLFVGLLVSIFQAATQINEQTLSFVPRLLITMLALLFFGPWLLNQVLSFTTELINDLGSFLY